jgi:hypothetical protein
MFLRETIAFPEAHKTHKYTVCANAELLMFRQIGRIVNTVIEKVNQFPWDAQTKLLFPNIM